MAQLRDIKSRISSVKKTKKITQAMKMVAAAKFKRATEEIVKTKSYSNAIESMIQEVASRLDGDNLPSIMSPKQSDREAIIVVTADRGLCGAYNGNILRFANREYLNRADKTDLFVIGNKGSQFFKKYKDSVKSSRSAFGSEMGYEEANGVISPILHAFNESKYGKVSIIYNEFSTSLTSNVKKKQLLPLEMPKQSQSAKSDYIYESGKQEVLETFFLDYLRFTVFRAILESQASEEGFRMTAMDSASTNAGEMIDDLTLIYNRTRQAQITREISEIVAGATSLSH